MAIDALNFSLNGGTYSLPVTGNSNVGTYGTLVQRSGNRNQKVLLAPYGDTSRTIVYSSGMQRYYYSANYPSLHCRKNNTNYSCCNNYQNYRVSVWRYEFTGGTSDGMASKTMYVHYAEDSYLGDVYNKYIRQTYARPYGLVTTTRSGYTFKGWNTIPDDTGDDYKTPVRARSTYSNATFYALWARIDEGTYGGKDFWNLLTSWFGGEPADNSFSSDKFSNHRVTLTIGNKTIQLYPGTKFNIQLTKKTEWLVTTVELQFGYQPEPNLISTALIGWYNSMGRSGYEEVVVSNGWLTDGGPSS